MTKDGEKTDPKTESCLKDLVRKRGSIKGRLTYYKKFVNLLENQVISAKERADLKLRMQGIINLYKEFSDVQNQIEEIVPDSESEFDKQLETRETFDNDYYSLMAQIKCRIGDDDGSSDDPKSNCTNNSIQSVKLPVISLPTFDGSYEHWLEFRDTYLSLVHNSKDITNIQKFHYLKSSLKGSAELIIDSLEFSADNYIVAWELLLNRYNNSRLLVHNHVKALFSIQTLTKESPSLLRKLIDIILKNLRALKVLGEPTEHWDTLIIYIVVSKLDPTTEREWEQYKGIYLQQSGDSRLALKIDDLLQYLKNRADMLETLVVSHSKANTHDAKKHNTNTHNIHKIHCNVVTDKPANKISKFTKKVCLMCHANHPLYSCQAFLDANIHDKLKFIREKNLCENCLRSGHSAGECRYGPCRKCDKKHNSLIHRDGVNENQQDNRAVALISINNKGLSDSPVSSATTSIVDKTTAVHARSHTQAFNNHTDVQSAQSSSSVQYVLLSTALVEIADSKGHYQRARAVLDNGSERCFITQSLCTKLNTQPIQSTQQIKGVGNSVTQSTQVCNIELKSLIGSFITRIQCLVLPQITSKLPIVPIEKEQFCIPSGIKLADPTFCERQSIDLLLGADLFWDLLSEGKMRLSNGPFLQNTKLGWIISGPLHSTTQFVKQVRCNFTHSINTQTIDTQLRRFWELEELPINKNLCNTQSDEERACEEHFMQTTKRIENGRFCVRIPFKQSPDTLGDTLSQAKRRFIALEKRLQRNPAYKHMYSDFIKEYIALGHMTRVTTYGTPHYFLPHHGVFREHSTTTKLRVVFDASAASTNGISLNDLQLIGPPIQGDLMAILLRFRENKYVACADVEKMYRQVSVHPHQRDLQLILWRDNPSDPLETYQLNTVTYGTASAPFLSCRCLKQLAQECTDPEIARTIREDFYVDDLIMSWPVMSELTRICQEIAKVLKSGCFPLRKWIFNFDFPGCTTDNDDISKELSLGEHANSKMLGLGWYNQSDELHFNTKFESDSNQITKRTILSGASQVFDPLGLLSPTIIIAKALLQKLWLLKSDWDEPVPDDVKRVWNAFVNNLSKLNNLRVPRHVMCDNPTQIELHIFTDASQTAYGACAYIRTIDNNSSVTVNLLCSKGKVAPIKPVSIPRLELCGALVGARLFAKIRESLRSCFDKVVFWTDSTIVLGWLRMSPNLLKTFVQNRAAEIHELTKENSWHHVSGKDNPADLVSRGLSLDALSTSSLWWYGPQFLFDSNFTISSSYADLVPEVTLLPEIKSNSVNMLLSNKQDDKLFPFSRFSQFNRMTRACAYALRFIHNARNRFDRRTGQLTASELKDAVLSLARLSQLESFPDVNKLILNKKSIHKYNNLSRLNIFIDDNNIIRVGGRILNSPEFSFNKKHPILISCKHHFSLLLFRHEHKQLLHAAPQLLLFTLRETWWPIGGRNLAKKVVYGCTTCSRMRSKTLTPIMGNLPPERLDPGFPFLHCGVDYAGPVLILNRKGRGAKTMKSYICIFVCFTTRAVHLELVSDLSSEAYLLTLKRFISRRGKPAEIFSDNGKNFVGVKNDFANFLNNIYGEVKEYALTQNIRFLMGPPYCSHFGGLWEAGVKSCKHHLRRIVGNAHLTFEEFSTVLTQVEAVLNSRPLTPMSTDPHDFLPLSPAHFLIGRPLTAPVSADLSYVPEHRLTRYQRVEQIRQHFWSRWSKEYVSELQMRSKWKDFKGELKVDTLVLIKEDNAPPLKWSLGRIVKTFPGKDGVARVADIRTVNGIVRRAFPKICPLPLADE